MTMHASWVHGNALTVETPEHLAHVGHFGWGADMAILNDVRTNLHRVFLLFDSVSGSIRNVHVYDGSAKVQEFNDLFLQGEHRLALDGQNTFNLAHPHTVVWGIGISFYFIASIGFDTTIPPARLILGAAGGDFFI